MVNIFLLLLKMEKLNTSSLKKIPKVLCCATMTLLSTACKDTRNDVSDILGDKNLVNIQCEGFENKIKSIQFPTKYLDEYGEVKDGAKLTSEEREMLLSFNAKCLRATINNSSDRKIKEPTEEVTEAIKENIKPESIELPKDKRSINTDENNINENKVEKDTNDMISIDTLLELDLSSFVKRIVIMLRDNFAYTHLPIKIVEKYKFINELPESLVEFYNSIPDILLQEILEKIIKGETSFMRDIEKISKNFMIFYEKGYPEDIFGYIKVLESFGDWYHFIDKLFSIKSNTEILLLLLKKGYDLKFILKNIRYQRDLLSSLMKSSDDVAFREEIIGEILSINFSQETHLYPYGTYEELAGAIYKEGLLPSDVMKYLRRAENILKKLKNKTPEKFASVIRYQVDFKKEEINAYKIAQETGIRIADYLDDYTSFDDFKAKNPHSTMKDFIAQNSNVYRFRFHSRSELNKAKEYLSNNPQKTLEDYMNIVFKEYGYKFKK